MLSLNLNLLRDEGEKMRDLVHPNLVRLLGMSFIKEHFCLVLEWLDGGTLKGYLRRNDPTLSQELQFCIDIASGMAYLASRQFFHRDLAARNCLLTKNGRVKVADFGLSKEGSHLKKAGHFSRQKSIIYNLPEIWL